MIHLRSSAFLFFVILSNVSFANFHFMKVNEVLTGVNGDTTIQFVELQMDAGQNFVSGHSLVSKNATGTVTATYTFPSNVSSGAAQAKILLATQAFANLGIVTPDFILPANFLNPTAGQVSFADGVYAAGTVSYGAYTGTGTNGTTIQSNSNADNKSLTRVSDTLNDNNDFQSLTNSPTNNAGQTGVIPALSGVNDWAMY